ncbi:hypothetical protein CR513_62939, partial [Mucuna pruriens]
MEISKRSVHWYPKWNERETFNCKLSKISKCSSYGNSGYNPMVTLRQNGYPMLTTPLELHGRSMRDIEWFRKIRQAWRQVMWKGPECRPRSCGATTGYKDWLRQHVECNGLPFIKMQ